MNYNEKKFKESANKKAMLIWTLLCAVLSLAFYLERLKGSRTTGYLIFFLAALWVPHLCGAAILKLKGMDTDMLKHVIAYGYGVSYAIILFTSKTPLAFCYTLPLAAMLVLYKDKGYMIRVGLANLTTCIIYIYLQIRRGFVAPENITDYEIILACIILSFLSYIVALSHMVKSDNTMLKSVTDSLDEIVSTVDKVKLASSSVVDGVVVVRELEEENKISADSVVNNMTAVIKNNNELSEKTDSSLRMTEDISHQVINVADKINNIVTLSKQSGENATVGATELVEVVETTHKIANLSSRVSSILENFQKQYLRVQTETAFIEDISNQTGLLAVNASIESARAGKAGKSFSVVAQQIKDLSAKSNNSSQSIMDALKQLGDVANDITTSIHDITELITLSLEKIESVNTGVQTIASDSLLVGSEIENVNTAIREVENANTNMVQNMQEINDIMSYMTQSLEISRDTTETMVTKFEESNKQVANIEVVVGKLMEELGSGGFMRNDDIKNGMMFQFISLTNKTELRTEVFENTGKEIYLLPVKNHTLSYMSEDSSIFAQSVVNNVLYIWMDFSLEEVVKDNKTLWKIEFDGPPTIKNRRKYKRMPLKNDCIIVINDEETHGKMVNLSAGGFAFTSNDDILRDMQGKDLQIIIRDLEELHNIPLKAKVIRLTSSKGQYNVGCRMYADNYIIKDLVNAFYDSNI